ncbi:beta-ketoacyl-ACP reductase [Pontibacter sp. JH31]|uniref:Beta-ketoacyl-ACP reductase n=1 Tax=Pontibacter aquaedesilientis TaxID=2766980 RepID=A0ABR7XFY5_9BACT|nr:beta-ketoacyl synthase N-terminal-like domain-containing protein [Pontibacter aquaedesilientis]MBD1397191.1 beta-ketoacyl-ACP reductase [Pontibacter aquaedesilientis]
MEDVQEHIVIRGFGAILPLGIDEAGIAHAYNSGIPAFKTIQHQNQPTPVAALPPGAELELERLINSNPEYRQLDRSVLMAIYAARQACQQAGWLTENGMQQDDLAVNIGSSRGATGLFEQYFQAFQQEQLSASSSPTTTLGNLSSWVAHAVNAGGAQISHSITCSTALMAIANGIAWLKSGMAERFLAGGTEAPLTDFTIAQMKAIGIYSKLHDHPYPCQPFGAARQNTFVLGEGAGILALEKVTAVELQPGDVIVEAVGLGFEPITSKTGISTEGLNFQKSMRQAIRQLPQQDQSIDLIITHTPGTRSGDKAELAAINAVFGGQTPALSTNKWLVGHTLGASGALSLQYALILLRYQQLQFPKYPLLVVDQYPTSLRRIMINAAGFGGNAASLLLRIIQ